MQSNPGRAPNKPTNHARVTPRRVAHLSTPEAEKLTRCEAAIEGRANSFEDEAEALLTIKEHKLYGRPYYDPPFRSMTAYCQHRWGYAKSTISQKLEVARTMRVVHNCELKPHQEYQVRKLNDLPIALRREVWERAVDLHRCTGEPLTAALVHKAVTLVRQQSSNSNLVAFLQPDRVFPEIPFRWEACHDDHAAAGLDLAPLPPAPLGHDQASAAPPSSGAMVTPLVFVSPDIDMITESTAAKFLPSLVKVMAAYPTYRFLCWTVHPEVFTTIPVWPANIERMVRITTQAELETACAASASGISTLWLLPTEPLTLPSPVPFTRILVGGPSHLMPKRTQEIQVIYRRLLRAVLNKAPALHIAVPVLTLLTDPLASDLKSEYTVDVQRGGR